MAGYCAVVDVQALTGKTYSVNSKPSSTEVDSFIEKRARIIDGILKARGYIVPVLESATQATEIVKDLNALGAAVLAENAMPGVQQASPRAAAWREEWRETLRLLERGKLDLIDATTTDQTQLSQCAQSPDGQFNLDSDGNEKGPVFSRDTVF